MRMKLCSRKMQHRNPIFKSSQIHMIICQAAHKAVGWVIAEPLDAGVGKKNKSDVPISNEQGWGSGRFEIIKGIEGTMDSS